MGKKGFLYFNVATCWKLSTMFLSSQIDSTAKIGHTECIKHDLELVYGKKVFSVFQCCNLLKTVHNVHFISNIQHSKNWTSRVHQTWFRACLWKKVFSVFQCCNLLKTVHNVHFISNIQHSKNWTSGVHQTWFRACLCKKRFFCISMLQLAENCPQCSFHLK